MHWARDKYKITILLCVLIGALLAVFSVFSKNLLAAKSKAMPNPKVLELTGPVYLSKCTPCHRNLDAWKNPGLIFNHPVHLERGFECKACHLVFAHQPGGKIVKPPMEVCYECHSLRHSENGLVASEECDFCHPSDFNLKPANHTNEFEASEHKERAKKDLKYCLMCHKRKTFCAPCHTSKNAKTEPHKSPAWEQAHGKQDLQELQACNICHNDEFCTECHKTPMPHPVLWVGDHNMGFKQISRGEFETLKDDCNICHKDRSYCQNCHHKFENNLLLQENCDSCHEEYKMPFVTIARKGFKIHKAHFHLTQTAPYECEKCHSLLPEFPKGTGCFPFEVCFQCHGVRKDDKLVAKWYGEDLCYFCHGKE